MLNKQGQIKVKKLKEPQFHMPIEEQERRKLQTSTTQHEPLIRLTLPAAVKERKNARHKMGVKKPCWDGMDLDQMD